jgi:acetyltransferase-like isoleucine patch superfamily enzyme
MIKLDMYDADRLRQHQIVCTHLRETKGNWIYLSETAIPQGDLVINIAGDRNEITITGPYLPIGTIHFVESDSKVEISSLSHVNIAELWMYSRSRFWVNECLAIFGLHAWIYNDTALSIGKNCLISDQVRIRTSDHHSIIDLATLQQINFPGNICLKEQVWIGQGVTILKGVEIGEGSIVSSSALVDRSIPRTELWGGVPARCLRRDVSWVVSHPAVRSHVEALAKSLGLS